MIESGFFASKEIERADGKKVGDRLYDDGHFAAYYAALVSSGVILTSAASLQVRAGTNMTLTVGDGQAMLEGRWLRATNGETVTIPNSNGAYSRYDRVCVRADYAARECRLVVIQGAAASSPTPPAIVRDGGRFDISLAVVRVPAAATRITQADIADTRFDNSVCGIVTGLIDQIDTTDLFAQFSAQWYDFVNQLGESEYVTIINEDVVAREMARKALRREGLSKKLNLI